jgi:hypothetical protein
MDLISRGGKADERAAASRLRRAVTRLGPDLAPFRHSRQFLLLYGGQATGFCGSMIGLVAMPYQAYLLSRSSLVVGLLSCTDRGGRAAGGLRRPGRGQPGRLARTRAPVSADGGQPGRRVLTTFLR